MKIAIAATGKNINSRVSEVSGRAPYYLIFEGKKLLKVIKNPFKIGGGGAGFGVAQMLADEKVKLVISGMFGANMMGALKAKKIKTKEAKDRTVKEVLEEINAKA